MNQLSNIVTLPPSEPNPSGSAWITWSQLKPRMEYGGAWEVMQPNGEILVVKCFTHGGIAWKTLQRMGWKQASKCKYRRVQKAEKRNEIKA